MRFGRLNYGDFGEELMPNKIPSFSLGFGSGALLLKNYIFPLTHPKKYFVYAKNNIDKIFFLKLPKVYKIDYRLETIRRNPKD